MSETHPVTLDSVLRVLSKDRLVQLGRGFDVAVSRDVTREAQVKALLASGRLSFTDLLRFLGRDELKAACRAHALDASGRARASLARQLAEASGEGAAVEPKPILAGGSPVLPGPGLQRHDLSRATALKNPDSSIVQVIAFGRLSIFGQGATRLHDQLIPVAAEKEIETEPGQIEELYKVALRRLEPVGMVYLC